MHLRENLRISLLQQTPPKIHIPYKDTTLCTTTHATISLPYRPQKHAHNMPTMGTREIHQPNRNIKPWLEGFSSHQSSYSEMIFSTYLKRKPISPEIAPDYHYNKQRLSHQQWSLDIKALTPGRSDHVTRIMPPPVLALITTICVINVLESGIRNWHCACCHKPSGLPNQR